MDVHVLDKNYQILCYADVFKSVVWTTRYNSVGEFEMVLPVTLEYLRVFQHDNYLARADSDTYMIIDEIEIKTNNEDGDEMTVKGVDLTGLLYRRVISSYTTLNGSLQDVIKKLLNENVINPSDISRRIPNFTFKEVDDSYINSLTVDYSILGTNLGKEIEALCQAADIGFRVLPKGNGGFEFSLYRGIDRSYNQNKNPYVVFSPNFENLSSSRYYASKANYMSVMYIGGEGEGIDQVIFEINDGSSNLSGLKRYEMFDEINVSRNVEEGETLTDAEYEAQVKAKGQESLAEYFEIETFDGEADANRQFIYGIDFVMGDIVQVVNDWNIESASRIVEVMISDDEKGCLIYPTFSSLS